MERALERCSTMSLQQQQRSTCSGKAAACKQRHCSSAQAAVRKQQRASSTSSAVLPPPEQQCAKQWGRFLGCLNLAVIDTCSSSTWYAYQRDTQHRQLAPPQQQQLPFTPTAAPCAQLMVGQ
jgi:hypothetical protein